MLNVANGFDGIWSSVIGGLIGAAAVLVGVLVAQRSSDRSRREVDRRQAAVAVAIEVGHLRDAVVKSRTAGRGEWPLWPLRTQLIATQQILGSDAGYAAALEFHDAADRLRDWLRHGPVAEGERERTVADDEALARYQLALSAFADRTIQGLNKVQPLESPRSSDSNWPDLPWGPDASFLIYPTPPGWHTWRGTPVLQGLECRML